MGTACYLARSNDLRLKVIASPNLIILSPSLLFLLLESFVRKQLETRGELTLVQAVPPAPALRVGARALKGGERI